MAQKPEDFNLPLSAISKIIKDAIPEEVKVTDIAKMALSKAASVFVLYATSSANSLSVDSNRKRLLAKDVIDALKDLDFDFLLPPLHNSLTTYRKGMETKKQTKGMAKVHKRNDSQREEEDPEDDMEIETSHAPDVITLDSDSGSEKEDTNNDSAASSSSSTDRHKMKTKRRAKVNKQNNSQEEEEPEDEIETPQDSDIITLDSDSGSGYTKNDSDASSSNE